MADDLFGKAFRPVHIDTDGAVIHARVGGSGEPLLLLHGYPQTHVMWHKVAPALARHYRVVCPDLRGYGDSTKPDSDAEHLAYSKRIMARDMIAVMRELGHESFFAAGHDRGARVVHRMTLDHPQCVRKACVMDIAPTHHMYETTDQTFATAYYHWFFLIQPNGLPEHMIGNDPEFFLLEKLKRWSGPDAEFDPRAVREYLRCFADPATIHASCEDYRAAASIDLRHDEEDAGKLIECPLLVLWGQYGFVHRHYDVLATWRMRARNAFGRALESGHFLAEEQPQEVLDELTAFFV